MGAGARTVEEDAGISPTHWLATMHQDGSPHVMPVWTFWVDSAFYFVSGATTRKSKNLAQNAHCVIAVASTGLDLIVEGEATKVYDETKLQQIADYSRDRLRPGSPTVQPAGASRLWLTKASQATMVLRFDALKSE